MSLVALHRHQHIWSSSYLFQTSWTDCGKRRLLPVDRSVLKHSMSLTQVVQGYKRGVCFGIRSGGLQHLRPLWYTESTTVVSTATQWGVSSVAPLSSAAKNWGRQMVVSRASVCTHSAMGDSLRGPHHWWDQSIQQRLGPTTGSLAAAGALAIGMLSCGWVDTFYSWTCTVVGAEPCPECMPGGRQ